jgi:hypothetical protein
MRMQQLAACTLLLALTARLGVANAEGPGGPPPGKGKPAEARPDKAPAGKPERGKPEAATGEQKGHKDHAGKPDRAGKEEGSDDDAVGHSGPRGGMRELFGELKAGKLKKGEVQERLGKLREKRDERAKAHRQQLKERFGNVLAMPAAREELEHHARRMARLDRAMVVCETEPVKDKDKLKERIQKLMDKESARHQQAMERMKSMPTTPAASAAAPASPPAAPAASVAVEKGSAP